jgi:hypothetical protein
MERREEEIRERKTGKDLNLLGIYSSKRIQTGQAVTQT